ncbi:MAG: hypothetical protein HQK89_12720, partial [Nitrospirae bacterium]|nr:hypothetical protein [Nitrospirota bacterium]
MPIDKAAKDLMIDIFGFPHVPYWFTIKQAIGILRKSYQNSGKAPYPPIILVFEEKYSLVGLAGVNDILRGLAPKFLVSSDCDVKGAGDDTDETALTFLWEDLFDFSKKELLQRQLIEIMEPVKHTINAGDPVTKAAYVMLRHNKTVLPV